MVSLSYAYYMQYTPANLGERYLGESSLLFLTEEFAELASFSACSGLGLSLSLCCMISNGP